MAGTTNSYRAMLGEAAGNLDAATQAELEAKVKAKMAKSLLKAQGILVKAGAEPLLSKQLKSYSKAAKILQDWTGSGGSDPRSPLYVFSQVQVAGPSEGYDLDTSGSPDNALAGHLADLLGMGLDLNQALTDDLAVASEVVVSSSHRWQ